MTSASAHGSSGLRSEICQAKPLADDHLFTYPPRNLGGLLTMVETKHPLHMLLRRNILLRLEQPIYCCYSSSYLETLVAMYKREDSPVKVVPECIESVVLGMIFTVACDLSGARFRERTYDRC